MGGQGTLLDGLVGYWKLEEASGDVNDEVGTNDGSVSGATYQQTGKLNYCLSFDGGNDYMTMASYDDDANNDISVAFWIKLDSFTDEDPIFYQGNGYNSANAPWVIRVDTAGGNTIQWRCYDGSWQTLTSGALTAGVWYHVVVTQDESDSGTVTLYVNGSYVDDTTTGVIVDGGTLTMFGWMGRAHTENRWTPGDLDEIAIWNRPLDSDEVSAIYNSGSGLAYSSYGVETQTPSAQALTLTQNSPTLTVDLPPSSAQSLTVTLNDPSFTGAEPDIGAVSTIKSSRLKTNHPIKEGLFAPYTKLKGRQINLVPTKGSLVPRRKKVGM